MKREKRVKLREIAGVIRSKNSGPFEITFDIIFNNYETFEQVVRGGSITKELFAVLYRVQPENVSALLPYPPAKAIKITMKRPRSSGSLGETDVYGAQQHAPLLDLEVLLVEVGEE